MSDDAEWIDICEECDSVRPARPRPLTTTRRPFWATAPATAPRPTPWPPRYPYTSPTPWPPRYPYTTPKTEHEEAERSLPLEPSHKAAIFGSLGAVLLLVLFGLLVYLLVLRRKLRKAESNRRLQDYSIRVEDVAHLSSPINDSSQLYVNTSDLHKLVSSVSAKRKHPPAPPASGSGAGRAKCPAPGEAIECGEQSTGPTPSSNLLKRISGHLSALGFNLQIPRNKTSSEVNAGYGSSMANVVKVGVPEILDDDDLWSEDSFDSCSVGYENETTATQLPTRGSSTRQSSHGKQKGSAIQKKINPPRMPPPPPPTAKPAVVSDETNVSGAPEVDTEKSFVAIPKASEPYGKFEKIDDCSPLYGNIEASICHTAIQVPQVTSPTLPTSETNYDSPKSQGGSRNQNLNVLKAFKNYDSPASKSPSTSQSFKKPLLPPGRPSRPPNFSSTHSAPVSRPVGKINPNDSVSEQSSKFVTPTHNSKVHPEEPTAIGTNKPLPPTAPKPIHKLNSLPKLKINLLTPKAAASEETPDTTTTVVLGTPSQDCHLFESNKHFPLLTSPKPKVNTVDRVDSIDPSSLSVSARRALIESKAVSGS